MIQQSSITELLTVTGTINTSGENIIVAAQITTGSNPGKRIVVTRYKLRTSSTVAVIIMAKDSAGGTVVDTDILQAPTNGVFGSNESTPAPSWLFRTLRGKDLVLNLSGNISVTYSITYYLSEL